MRAIKRLALYLVVVALSLLLLTACNPQSSEPPAGSTPTTTGQSGPPAPPPATPTYTLTVSGQTTEFDYLTPFSAEGLTVTRTSSEGGEPVVLTENEFSVTAVNYKADVCGEYTVTVEDIFGDAPDATYTVRVKPLNSLKVLIIGNSFGDDTMAHLYQVGLSAGIPAENIKLVNLFIGGCSLATHVNNANTNAAAYEFHLFGANGSISQPGFTLQQGFDYADWDYVVLQQVSQESGRPASYSALDQLIPYVKEKAPDAKLVFNMTWAYQQNSTHSGFQNYGRSQEAMFNAILNTMGEEIDTRDFALCIPCGTAIQNARTSFLGDTLTRDGYHLSYDYGRYIAALTAFGKLTGHSLDDVTFAPTGLWGGYTDVCKESARNAITTDWQVTPSVYLEEPTIDLTQYEQLDIDFTVGQYWYPVGAAEYNRLTGSGDFGMRFAATPRYTAEDLPVGTLIVVAEGWRYRPDFWITDAQQTSRASEVSAEFVILDETFFDGYLYRAFNISRIDGKTFTQTGADPDDVFQIYIPK